MKRLILTLFLAVAALSPAYCEHRRPPTPRPAIKAAPPRRPPPYVHPRDYMTVPVRVPPPPAVRTPPPTPPPPRWRIWVEAQVVFDVDSHGVIHRRWIPAHWEER